MKCQVNLQFGCMKIFLRHSRIHFKSRLFSKLNCLILLPPQNLTNMHNKHFKQLFPLVQFGCPNMLRNRRIYFISNFKGVFSWAWIFSTNLVDFALMSVEEYCVLHIVGLQKEHSVVKSASSELTLPQLMKNKHFFFKTSWNFLLK